MSTVVVTKPERHGSFWTARASVDGTTRVFHDRFGSWQTDRRPRADADWPQNAARKEAAPSVARALTAKTKRLERRARLSRRRWSPVEAIKPGVRVLARAYDGELLERVAMTEVIDGDDFPVVWVCREEEWEAARAERREADGIPWPAEDVRMAETVHA